MQHVTVGFAGLVFALSLVAHGMTFVATGVLMANASLYLNVAAGMSLLLACVAIALPASDRVMLRGFSLAQLAQPTAFGIQLRDSIRLLPKSTKAALCLCASYTLVLSILFLVESGGAVPREQKGDYYLEARGTIVRVLTQAEYLELRVRELRLNSGMSMTVALFAGIIGGSVLPRLELSDGFY